MQSLLRRYKWNVVSKERVDVRPVCTRAHKSHPWLASFKLFTAEPSCLIKYFFQ